MWKYIHTDELYHYGILGMRWGKRTGGKTSSSKGKTSSSKGKTSSSKGSSSSAKGKQKTSKTDKKDVKSIKDMSDDELRTKTNRMNLEINYNNAVKNMKSINPQQTSKGKRAIQYIGKEVILPAAVNVGRQLVTSFLVEQSNRQISNITKKGIVSDDLKTYTNNKRK